MYKTIQLIAAASVMTAMGWAQNKPDTPPSNPELAQPQTGVPLQPHESSKKAEPAGKQSKGTADGSLPSWLSISADLRGRWEDGITSMPGNVTDSYFLTQIRLNTLIKVTPWLRFSAQVQDARALRYDKGQPPASMHDPLDLRQAWVEAGGSEGRGPSVRFGRQEIIYGNARVIGQSGWSNTGRAFDAIRGAYRLEGANLEFLAGSVVLQDQSRFDRHKPGEHLYGTYDTFTRLLPKATVEPYFFVKTVTGVTGEAGSPGNSTQYVGGLRFAGRLPAKFDYSLEAVHENGSYAEDRISAFGAVYTLGWTSLQSHWKPRFSADYTYASGDNNAKDSVHGTFDQMYGNQQPFFSLTGMVGWKNIRNTRAGVEFSPAKRFKVSLDYRNFNLATVQDGLYNGTGTRVFLNRKATSDHVGAGADARVEIQLPGAMTTSFGLGTIFPGEYLHQAGQHGACLYPYFAWTKHI